VTALRHELVAREEKIKMLGRSEETEHNERSEKRSLVDVLKQ